MLVNNRLCSAQCGDLIGVFVNTDDFMAQGGKTHRANEANISCAKNSDIQNINPLCDFVSIQYSTASKNQGNSGLSRQLVIVGISKQLTNNRLSCWPSVDG